MLNYSGGSESFSVSLYVSSSWATSLAQPSMNINHLHVTFYMVYMVIKMIQWSKCRHPLFSIANNELSRPLLRKKERVQIVLIAVLRSRPSLDCGSPISTFVPTRPGRVIIVCVCVVCRCCCLRPQCDGAHILIPAALSHVQQVPVGHHQTGPAVSR